MASSAIDANTIQADAQSALSPEAILKSFANDIQPIRTTATYRLGILAVSVVMVLLPLIYIALIVDGDVLKDISILEDRQRFIAVMQNGIIKAGQLYWQLGANQTHGTC